MIGRSFPLGNTWDAEGGVVSELEDHLNTILADHYEPENTAVIEATTKLKPQSPIPNFTFYPRYGWDGQPMLFSIASLFASTITELKFCGFQGSPILRRPASSRLDITPGILHHLQYFHNLEQLILSIYVLRKRDVSRVDIITNWRTNSKDEWTYSDLQQYGQETVDERSQKESSETSHDEAGPQSTSPPNCEGNLKAYEGPAIAISLWEQFSPHISPIALKKGVNLRASFCIGEEMNEDIFDLNIGMNENGLTCVKGPCSIWDGGRWWSKLTERSYF
jgi:hypothetical protein